MKPNVLAPPKRPVINLPPGEGSGATGALARTPLRHNPRSVSLPLNENMSDASPPMKISYML